MIENKTFEEKAKITEVLGEAILVLMNSNAHRLNFFIGDIEWLLLSPISKEQFRLIKIKKENQLDLFYGLM